ncbi:TPA: hypothetical protein DCL30_04795 [Candidatus Peribacteria bacterium]|nr:MAG: hypothetical protein A2529_04855 [Candidatus Peribacteria bacterium RIFOXYD2_FULL_58_15]HAI98820.1 hypothetical protein [Candidatus Peribacteria bacterium]HAS34058.1 hypothetical protein [Candidatus Peribacteria bacterium]
MAKQRSSAALIVALSIVGVLLVVIRPLHREAQVLEHPAEEQVASAAVLSRALLDESLALGRGYLLANQKEEGNFNYEYDFLTRAYSTGDNQVRQAGPLWALALIHRDQPSPETRDAVLKGFAFFRAHSKELPDGRRIVIYPHSKYGETGTVSILSLALIEFLRVETGCPECADLTEDLDGYLKFLLSQKRKDGQYYEHYAYKDGASMDGTSSYFDGETLLALSKAARYLGHDELKDPVLDSAKRMYHHYVTEALQESQDPAILKSFYQWGTMAYYEIATSGWEDADVYGDHAIEMTHWMIGVHDVLERTFNTGYAFEGIMHAYELARRKGDTDAEALFRDAAQEGLGKLTTWQVGIPVANDYLRAHSTDDPLARGGVMNAADNPKLRIDVTQHQMHAVLLAREFLYPAP